jgi:hypothetical protein
MNKRYLLILLSLFFFMACNKKEEKKPEVTPVEQVKDTVPKEEPIKKEVKTAKKDPVITFTVQIGAFKKYGQSFAKLPNVTTYSKGDYSKYSLGSFHTVKEAVNFMYSIEEDYPDAFVQALKDGEPIHIKEALK